MFLTQGIYSKKLKLMIIKAIKQCSKNFSNTMNTKGNFKRFEKLKKMYITKKIRC